MNAGCSDPTADLSKARKGRVIAISASLLHFGAMLPPWRKYPNVPLGSVGWRMGHGEDYWIEFDDWFKHKPMDQQHAYAMLNPEPAGWAGFYQCEGNTA